MPEQRLTTNEAGRNVSRRGFLLGLLAGAGTTFAAVLGYAGYQWFTPRDDEPSDWQAVGAPEDFPVGETLPVVLSQPAGTHLVWLRRTKEEEFIAFSSSCTHLGATVTWQAEQQRFQCAVHGGLFNADGTVQAGPPPRPLDRHEVRVIDGRVVIERRPERSASLCCQGCMHAACAICTTG